ncbi:unnamed protein product [Toxocara canis]|uniref:Transcriptional regulator n=1 Tax=Toxocara canis TaxID=6265 RepID=A0A183U4U7_TOXCA|nr:unnamed protein product [Toxocara canis]
MANFDQTLLNIATNGMLSIVISLGQQLKLFDALAEIGSESSPATAKDVANRLKLKERLGRSYLWLKAAVLLLVFRVECRRAEGFCAIPLAL